MIEIIDYKSGNIDKLLNRSQINDEDLLTSVKKIIDDVKIGGDKALETYVEKFEKHNFNEQSLIVSEEEFDDAYSKVSTELLAALRRAKQNIIDYHANQTRQGFIDLSKESKTGWIMRPYDRAAIYVPGGKAAYPSTVLMCVLPAVVAGVKDIALCTPNAMPLTLVAARECGVKTVYRMGGAHAIAALAYGTESIKRADIIAGPGNVYVTMAKKLVYGSVNIDMIAGPSEIIVVADDSANYKFVAADLLSQAEHDEMAAAILITDSRELAQKVQSEIGAMTAKLERKNIIEASIKNNGAIVIVDNIDEAIELANKLAPEHLELCVKDGEMQAMKVRNAGALFVGNYSPEPLGDYYAGPSHTLPTSGSARYFSVLNVDTFMKKMSYIEYTRGDLLSAADDIIMLARAEGLTAHANSIIVRKEEN